MSPPWTAGTQIMLRHALAGRTWALVPVTVVEDSTETTVFRISAGSSYLAPHDESGRLLRLGPSHWGLAHRRWTTHDLLYLVPKGSWFALALQLEPGTSRPVGWYVNFQEIAVRRPWGLDSLDLELDLVSTAEGTTTPRWEVKDADRFQSLVATGFLTAEQHRATIEALREVSRPDALRHERATLLRCADLPGREVAELPTAARHTGAVPPDVTRDVLTATHRARHMKWSFA